MDYFKENIAEIKEEIRRITSSEKCKHELEDSFQLEDIMLSDFVKMADRVMTKRNDFFSKYKAGKYKSNHFRNVLNNFDKWVDTLKKEGMSGIISEILGWGGLCTCGCERRRANEFIRIQNFVKEYYPLTTKSLLVYCKNHLEIE